ncbi:hypothetical protein HDF26_001990 [Pedobacter cryoconitis]|uniref:MbnP family protein n=1 Tax=Pedobacter cryoconitis TaxID=188932 RepID=UPI0016215BDC|nr:MbnP family protein [Pedobacter cryoconitis]MBB6271563.1 hypothetical protein [Pedobacter cryoconitis]
MKTYSFILFISTILFISCRKDEVKPDANPAAAGQLTLSFDAILGTNDFALNKDFIVNGKTCNFTQLRYWVSNVILVNTKGEEFAVPNAYYLIEENNAAATNSDFIYPANKREDVKLSGIPAGTYKSIKFAIGVPEKYNNNLSLQAGELSQLNGMTNVSWMWSTSYIFSSLKGKVADGNTTSTAAAKELKIETGLNVNFKTIVLNLPSALNIGGTSSSAIVLNTDVSKITEGVDIMATPTVGASQASVMSVVAGNYAAKVFTVKSVK